MGCCISHPFFEKETVYEVTLDSNGVAHRASKGQGTHFIHISSNNETHLEEKKTDPQLSCPAPTHNHNNNKWPSLPTPASYTKRVHPISTTDEEVKEEKSLP